MQHPQQVASVEDAIEALEGEKEVFYQGVENGEINREYAQEEITDIDKRIQDLKKKL